MCACPYILIYNVSLFSCLFLPVLCVCSTSSFPKKDLNWFAIIHKYKRMKERILKAGK